MTAPWREPAGSSRRDARRLEAEAVAAAETPLDDPFLRNELHHGDDAGAGRSDASSAVPSTADASTADAEDVPAEPQHDTIDLREQIGLPRTPHVPGPPDDADDLWRVGDAGEAALGDAEPDDAAFQDGAVEQAAFDEAGSEEPALDEAGPDEAAFVEAAFDETGSDQAGSDQAGSDQAVFDDAGGIDPPPTDVVEPSDIERQQTAIAVDAVHLLSQAQLIADRCVEDAEQYARDLVMVARTQYREILQRAEEVAAATLAGLPPTTGDSGVPHVPLPEIEYVRTYAQVARVQLRSVLDALTEQVDRLGNLPDLGVSRPDPMPMDLGDVSWDPDIDRAFR